MLDDDDDIRSEVSDLDPESNILAPVQRKIEGQLRANLEELSLALHETSNEARMMRTKREDCGVELYNVQQHLAKLQESLEAGHDNLLSITKLREEKEKERSNLHNDVDTVQKAVDDMAKKYVKFQNQLEKLSETLLKVEEFNEQIQSEIQIERRAAYKAEDEIVKLEKQKGRQDFLIDNLNERIHQLSEQHASLIAQLTAQKAETKVAKDTLGEALAEMESISFDKKQLAQQWKTSIIGMQRRDEALRTTEEALEEQKESLMALDNEIIGYRNDIKKAQNKNAKLSAALSKAESEVAVLMKEIDKLLAEKLKQTEKYNLLKRTLESTDEDNKTLDGDIRSLTSEIDSIVKRAKKAEKDVIDMHNKVTETLSKQTTLKKGSQSALGDIEKMKNNIRDKEMLVTQMENELSRIRVDTLQTQAHNQVLKQTVAELEKELQSRDVLIEKMQVDIRRKHDEIERKQKTLDSLNRQFDAITAAQGTDEGEHVGPLEATINNLAKAITQKTSENDSLQREWIKLQTELVNSNNYNEEQKASIRELQAQCTILTQKRARLTTTTRQQQEEITMLERTTQQMHLEMKKLNTLLCGNANNQEQYANENANLENDLIKRLQELKRVALQLEAKVDTIRQAKKDVLSQILDAERNVMLWEKKIQIAKETEMALDPTIGKDQINEMKRQIYVMEQRLSKLQQEQRRKIDEMQKLIDHRDALRTKGQAIQAATKANQKTVTKATVTKENNRLAQELTTKKTDAQVKEKQIRECLSNTEQTALEVEKVVQEIEDLEKELQQEQKEIDLKTQERNRVLDEKTRKQRSLQRFRDAEKGLYKLSCNPEELADVKDSLESKRRALAVIMQELSQEYPQIAPELRDLAAAL